MNKEQTSVDDPLHRSKEEQEHLYDPEYFTDGYIDPLLTEPRPKRYGCLLIVVGVLMLILMTITTMKEGLYWPTLVLDIPFTVLILVAGFKLIRKRSPKYDSENDEIGQLH